MLREIITVLDYGIDIFYGENYVVVYELCYGLWFQICLSNWVSALEWSKIRLGNWVSALDWSHIRSGI